MDDVALVVKGKPLVAQACLACAKRCEVLGGLWDNFAKETDDYTLGIRIVSVDFEVEVDSLSDFGCQLCTSIPEAQSQHNQNDFHL